MGLTLPTPNCTPELHEKYGGGCYHCCDRCNYDRHICHFCGDPLKHDEKRLWGGEINTCYAHCRICDHIGHLHYAGRCAECNLEHEYEPVEEP